MATDNHFKDISNRIIAQFKNINGGTDYNNTINDNYINKGFKSVDQADNYPSIWIASIGFDEFRPERRTDFDWPLSAEIFGYVQNQANAFEEAEDLASDMNKAICADEWLNSQINELTIEIGCTSLNEFGIVMMTIRGILNYSKD